MSEGNQMLLHFYDHKKRYDKRNILVLVQYTHTFTHTFYPLVDWLHIIHLHKSFKTLYSIENIGTNVLV